MEKINFTVGTVKMLKNYGQNPFKVNKDDSIKILEKALQLGICKLDTAESYGKLNSIIPESLLSCFDITSKISIDLQNPIQQIEEFFTKNPLVKKLLIHNADLIFENKSEDVIFTCSSYFKSIFGLSMYSPEYTKIALEQGIKNFQIPCNILDQRWDFFKNKDSDVYVEARSVFLQGILLKNNLKLPSLISTEYLQAINKIDKLSRKNNLSRLETLISGASKKYINSLVIGVSSAQQLNNSYKALNKVRENQLNLNIKTLNTNLLDPRKW